jgi:hypothetical protein
MRTINSPGVQITEKDLSLRTETGVGTNVVVPGFASQGPVGEPLMITTASELEAIYGIPTTPAEKYFYYSCREVLNSPAVLTTVRLPYGEDVGSDYSQSYSGLFYPVDQITSGGSTEWVVMPPKHVTLSETEYNLLLEGNFNWTSTSVFSEANVDLPNNSIDAGFFVLNDLQTVVNEVAEGYYIGLADNKAASSSSPNYESVTKINTLSSFSSDYSFIPETRLDFALSSTQAESLKGITSVSESLEKVGFVGFEQDLYQDHLSLGVYKIRRSTTDPSLLTLAASERYLGSLDYTRKEITPSGGILKNSFVEDGVNNSSPTIKMFINPAISKDFDWNGTSLIPTSRVTISAQAKALYPIGVYVPDSRVTDSTKIIGDVPRKLDKALRLLESTENTTVDLIVDAGLSNIFGVTGWYLQNSYNDEYYVDSIDDVLRYWRAVANTFINFAENVRKDCFAIIDPPRSIFLNGKDSKTIDNPTKTFTSDIYNYLKQVTSYETNYAAVYGNWIKISDIFTGRLLWAPFSAPAAAVFARSDAAANFWAAPAGLNRGTFSAVDIAFNPNQKQRDRLYEIGVNPVVYFSNDGYVIMGQKTLQTKPTAFDRINVRRLFLSLERSVQKTLRYFVFEPNTDFTRNRAKNVITPAFEFARNTDGLYDYLIVADERNNTAETIDRNEMIIDIYIKPVRTAEFILVNFIATRTGQDFQELI